VSVNNPTATIDNVVDAMRAYGLPDFWCNQVRAYAPENFLDEGKIWRLNVKGREVIGPEAGFIVMMSSDLGFVGIIHNGAYPTLFRWENGGGGVISVPYAIMPDGTILYGFVLENRLNIGTDQQLIYAMCGLRERDETPTATAARESMEEGNILLNWRLVPGSNVVLDRATSVADARQGHGVECTVCEVPFDALEPEGDYWVFKTQPEELKKLIRLYTKAGAFENTIDSLVHVGMTCVDVHVERLAA
jgi:8-oxo-dGTP pyrophosphatase MutT (NUDIX family)